ncbi:hypothetical protein [Pseudoponticoccus marisrubri]|uniref:Uncharacterized protein n=1 Tax=Pseudoponticoccus marisrubri TaxID=1685382 RepID=A0A0W7WQA8_9RHOB|nr:hypothetical protein [Pseudoponticoccus marisrubri]KUF12761.1 hypothetical protein AVJ23_03360 [Pseudoponticoccus marisrubri]
MSRTRKPDELAEDFDDHRPEVADLARGANGLDEPSDPQEIAQGLMAAQMQAMSTMMAASAEMTAATFRAMSQMWGASLPRGRGDREED